MMLGSPAHADGFSFTVHGQRIRVEASRHCRSTSCVSVSVGGLFARHRGAEDDDNVQAQASPPPAKPAVLNPPPVSPPPAAMPAGKPIEAKAIEAKAIEAKAVEAKVIEPKVIEAKAVETKSVEMKSVETKAVETTATVARPVAAVQPPVVPAAPLPSAIVASISSQISEQMSRQTPAAPAREPATTPVGDWRSSGEKGFVRIEACGGALCGHMVLPESADGEKGESVLVNMKAKADREWSGTIISRASGDSYYATMRLTRPNLLRVEACALGRFFCTANDWTRIEQQPQELLSTRQIAGEPRS
jgi:uncharacterized protein (DUF2147 family)